MCLGLFFKSLKRKWGEFRVNKLYAGTRCFEKKRKIMIGLGFEIGEGTKIVGPIYCTGKLTVGKQCWLGTGLTVHGNGNVVIGDCCDIAPEAAFLTGGHAIGNNERRAGEGETYRITVGDGVWIGARATLMKDITIGDGAVIAACAAVASDVEANTIVGGVPAKPIQRLDKDGNKLE